jgi:hypothetical protein
VHVARYLRRVATQRGRTSPDQAFGDTKRWEPTSVGWGLASVLFRAPSVEGIVVGRRTLSNGRTSWNGDDPTSYEATESIPAYLVAWHVDHDLIRVRPEDLEVLALPPELVVVDDDHEPDPRDVLL